MALNLDILFEIILPKTLFYCIFLKTEASVLVLLAVYLLVLHFGGKS